MTRRLVFISGFLALLLLASGFAGGFMLGSALDDSVTDRQFDDSLSVVNGQSGGATFEFINPLLECEHFNPSRRLTHLQLRTSVERQINAAITSGTVDKVSVYFRELNEGAWIGVDEDAPYSPASLLKVPIMFTLLREAESNPGILTQQLRYTAAFDTSYTTRFPDETIRIGQVYSVDELLTRMIRHSDNEAKELLSELLGGDRIAEVMNEIGIGSRGRDVSVDYLTVREYAAVFRLLYNATYLSREMSEKALRLLSTTRFEYGIDKALPPGTIVAHKFGERSFQDSPLQQLHDCGIVYASPTPYLLCVMTRGRNTSGLIDEIAAITRLVHEEMQKQRQ